MTPLVQESLATMATISTTHMSPPSSPKCPQHPQSPSPSSSGTASKLFRPWRPAEGNADREEGGKGDTNPKVQEGSTRRRRRKEGREARKSKKRVEEGNGRVEGQNPSGPSAQEPAWETPANPLRSPSRKSRDEGVPSVSSPSSSSPAPQGFGRPLPHDPHLIPPGLHPFFHPQQPPHPLAHLPPHLDPVLLAEMTDAELERLGLIGGYGAVDPGLTVCGGAHDPRGLSHPHSAAAGKKQRPKKYRCPHCQVAFSNNGQLRGHVRIHTGERPFSCEYEGCGKAFTRNEELTRHRRIHSGQRPFACPLCEKRFGRKDHLKKHARTHAPPPPSPHAFLLAPDPRLLLPPPLTFSPHHGLLVAGGTGDAADAALSPPSAQRIAEMAALAGFPYLYGY